MHPRPHAAGQRSLFRLCIPAWLALSGSVWAQDITRPSAFPALSGGGIGPRGDSGASGTAPVFRTNSPTVFTTRNPFPADMVPLDRPVYTPSDVPETDLPEDGGVPSPGLPPGVSTFPVRPPKERYNFRVGPVYFRVGVGLRVEATDNLVTGTEKEGDIIVSPTAYVTGHWQISTLNDLTLRLGVGYNYYARHSELGGLDTAFEINPGTAIAFKMKIGDVYVRVFDRPAIERQASGEVTLRNTFFFNTFSNTGGVSLFYDFNPIRITGGITRQDTIPFAAQQESGNRTLQQDFSRRATNAVFLGLSYPIEDYAVVGLDVAYSNFTYGGTFQNDGSSLNFGVNLSARLATNTTATLGVGWQTMDFSGGGQNNDTSDSSDFYVNASLNTRLGRFFNNAVSFTRESGLGTVTNSVQTSTISDSLTYSGAPRLPISLYAFYTIADESGGDRATSFSTFGAGVSVSYNLSQKMTLSLYYEFNNRTADGGDDEGDGQLLDYTQNRIGLNLNYAF